MWYFSAAESIRIPLSQVADVRVGWVWRPADLLWLSAGSIFSMLDVSSTGSRTVCFSGPASEQSPQPVQFILIGEEPAAALRLASALTADE
jgi:hypothetical protein